MEYNIYYAYSTYILEWVFIFFTSIIYLPIFSINFFKTYFYLYPEHFTACYTMYNGVCKQYKFNLLT